MAGHTFRRPHDYRPKRSSAVTAALAGVVSLKGTARGVGDPQAKVSAIYKLVGDVAGFASAQGKPLRLLQAKGAVIGKPSLQGKPKALYALRGRSTGYPTVRGALEQAPRIVAKRTFAAYLRFSSYKYGTLEDYRESAWHEPLIVEVPVPRESLGNRAGIQRADELEVTIADPALRTALEAGSLTGVAATLDLVTTTLYTNGETSESIETRGYTLRRWRYAPGEVRLTLVDLEDSRLETLYPDKLFNAADWPELFADHAGRPVPVAVRTAIKIPCTLIQTGAGLGPWKYAVCLNLGTPTVLTVYRAGRIVPASEYTTSTATAGGYTVVTISFPVEQADYSGNFYAIEADVQTTLEENAVSEIERLLVVAGATIDATSFNTAKLAATSAKMFASFAHIQQRTLASIIADLLVVARSGLRRTSTGAYQIVQDVQQTVARAYNENNVDEVQVLDYWSSDPPATLQLAYRPNVARPGELEHTVQRSAGGAVGTERMELALIRSHESADRSVDYQAKRRQYGAGARIETHNDEVLLNQVVAVASSAWWSGTKNWRVVGKAREGTRNVLELEQYDDTVYVYAAGTLPTDATTGYLPDYSKTPPDAPGSLTVVAQSVALNQDGVAQSHIQVKATPPDKNWQQIYFQARNTTTGEIYQQVGADNGDGTYGALLAGLRPNSSHDLTAWAVNAFSLSGTPTSTVNFTSTPWSSAPGVPTSVASSQGTGKMVVATCVSPTGGQVHHIKWFKKTGGGSFVVAQEVGTTRFEDPSINYGTAYQYKCRAVDNVGNESADSSTTSITPSVNVATGDIQSNAVSQVQSSNESFNVSLTTSYTKMKEVTITTQGGPVLVVCNMPFNMQYKANETLLTLQVEVRRDSSVLVPDNNADIVFLPAQANDREFAHVYAAMYVDTPGAGTYTYSFWAREQTGSGLGNVVSYRRTIQVTELKR